MRRRPLRLSSMAAFSFLLAAALPAQAPPEPNLRPRVRDLGVSPGVLPPGPLNAITDVVGVRVGHVTLIEGDTVRTGVTAVLAHGDNLFQAKVPAAVWAANAFGKAAGFLQVRELGTLETPIVLTNTLSVGTAVEATVRWTLAQAGNERVGSVNAVVGETNDGWLNDIRTASVTAGHVVDAIESAATGPVAEGNVGAGTGTRLFGWKGGIGSSSRALPERLGGHTVGVLVQANFGGVLTLDGARVGETLGRYAFREPLEAEQLRDNADSNVDGDGSCMIVVATDAPMSPRDLERLARRAPLGLARTGSFISNGSGDFVVAFSTAERVPYASEVPTQRHEHLRTDELSPLFLAVVEATEEAVYNALLQAETMTGQQGRTVDAIDLDDLRSALRRTRPSP